MMSEAALQKQRLQVAGMRKKAAHIAAEGAVAERKRADAEYEQAHAACKRQRTGAADAAEAAAAAAAGTASGADEGWLNWTPGNWQQNERKAATRRGVAVTPARPRRGGCPPGGREG